MLGRALDAALGHRAQPRLRWVRDPLRGALRDRQRPPVTRHPPERRGPRRRRTADPHCHAAPRELGTPRHAFATSSYPWLVARASASVGHVEAADEYGQAAQRSLAVKSMSCTGLLTRRRPT